VGQWADEKGEVWNITGFDMPQQEMKRPENRGDVQLFTKSGERVTTIRLPPGGPPDVIKWGARHYVLHNGAYREGLFLESFEGPR
jgi:hypothetical protein